MNARTAQLIRRLQWMPRSSNGVAHLVTLLNGERQLLASEGDRSSLVQLVHSIVAWLDTAAPRVQVSMLCELAQALALDAGDGQGAENLYRRALALCPTDFSIAEHAKRLFAQTRDEEAVDHVFMAQANLLDATKGVLPALRAHAYRRLGDMRADLRDLYGASEAYDVALEIEPDVETLIGLAETLELRRGQGDAHEASELYVVIAEQLGPDRGDTYIRRALELNPDSEAAQLLASTQMFKGRVREKPAERKPRKRAAAPATKAAAAATPGVPRTSSQASEKRAPLPPLGQTAPSPRALGTAPGLGGLPSSQPAVRASASALASPAVAPRADTKAPAGTRPPAGAKAPAGSKASASRSAAPAPRAPKKNAEPFKPSRPAGALALSLGLADAPASSVALEPALPMPRATERKPTLEPAAIASAAGQRSAAPQAAPRSEHDANESGQAVGSFRIPSTVNSLPPPPSPSLTLLPPPSSEAQRNAPDSSLLRHQPPPTGTRARESSFPPRGRDAGWVRGLVYGLVAGVAIIGVAMSPLPTWAALHGPDAWRALRAATFGSPDVSESHKQDSEVAVAAARAGEAETQPDSAPSAPLSQPLDDEEQGDEPRPRAAQGRDSQPRRGHATESGAPRLDVRVTQVRGGRFNKRALRALLERAEAEAEAPACEAFAKRGGTERVRAIWVVLPSGKVKWVRAKRPNDARTRGFACARDSIEALRFPKPRRGQARIEALLTLVAER